MAVMESLALLRLVMFGLTFMVGFVAMKMALLGWMDIQISTTVVPRFIMDKERRCQDPYRLCANNCGFFGSPATDDLCSKCYRDLRLAEERAQNAVIAVEKSLAATTSSKSGAAAAAPAAVSTVESSAAAVPAAEEPKRPARPSRVEA